MILNNKIRKMSEEITDKLYRIYHIQLLNDEINKDEYYFLILNDTIKYFSKIEEYEKCVELEKLRPVKLELSGLYGSVNNI
jgi:nicotinic acid mononucleotide adenylyltransferase